MKILHTADIHLREYDDARWRALQLLTDIGKTEDVGLMVISGDLFDEGIDAENLRPKIRETLSGNGFPIIILPGNHDVTAFPSGQYFGEDTHIIRAIDQPFETDSVRVCGLPFEEIEGNTLLGKIRLLEPVLTEDKTNVLLYHGELLDKLFSFSRADTGDEGGGRYMPAKLNFFDGLNIQYVLAGHFHTRFDVLQLPNGGYFVYPGSPVAITRRECGIRKINLFETGQSPKEYLLDTPYYHEINIALDPLDEQTPTEKLAVSLKGIHPPASILLSVSGYVNGQVLGMNETELKQEIDAQLTNSPVDRFEYKVRDITQILEDDLFKVFITKLDEKDIDEETQLRIRDVMIKAMTELRA